MRTIAILAAAAALLVTSPARADALKAGFPICITEDLLDQMYTAMLNKDVDGIEYLIGRGCAVTKAGVKASLLSRSDWGTRARVRVYAGKDAAEAWVSISAMESWKPY